MGIELSSSAPSVQFDAPGDTVTGVIVEADMIQQTKMGTGEPEYWDAAKTRPKMMPALKLHAPGHKDADESGHVSLYLSGGRYSAVKVLTKRLDEGATLTLTFSAYSDQEPAVKGHNRAKRYTAVYVAPPKGVSLDNTPAAAPAPAAAAGFGQGTPPF